MRLVRRLLREEFFETILTDKRRKLIVIYIIIDIFSGQKFKEGEMVLRFSLVLAIKAAKARLLYIN